VVKGFKAQALGYNEKRAREMREKERGCVRKNERERDFLSVI
jgi:hypothetical protein